MYHDVSRYTMISRCKWDGVDRCGRGGVIVFILGSFTIEELVGRDVQCCCVMEARASMVLYLSWCGVWQALCRECAIVLHQIFKYFMQGV